MKVTSSRPVTPARSTAVRGPASAGSASPSSPAPIHEVNDTASVMGIPASEMSPKVQAAIMALMQEVESMRQQLEVAHVRLAELERLADLDTLAPIPNRRAFVRELSRMISFSERYGSTSSLIYFDVNDLKKINDTYGHAAGDAALLHVATLLLENIRESDVVGRLGGDEFGVILVYTDEKDAEEKARFLAEKIKMTPFMWEGREFSIGAAYGAYSFRAGVDASKALAEADKAMYAQKRESKPQHS